MSVFDLRFFITPLVPSTFLHTNIKVISECSQSGISCLSCVPFLFVVVLFSAQTSLPTVMTLWWQR